MTSMENSQSSALSSINVDNHPENSASSPLNHGYMLVPVCSYLFTEWCSKTCVCLLLLWIYSFTISKKKKTCFCLLLLLVVLVVLLLWVYWKLLLMKWCGPAHINWSGSRNSDGGSSIQIFGCLWSGQWDRGNFLKGLQIEWAPNSLEIINKNWLQGSVLVKQKTTWFYLEIAENLAKQTETGQF